MMNIIGVILIIVFGVFCVLLLKVLAYLKGMWSIWETLRDAFKEKPSVDNMKELFTFIEQRYKRSKS